MRWQIHQKGKLQLLTEVEVMRRLADGKLTGLELARRGGEGDWHPLHATPLFQAVPHTGSAREAARERARRGLLFHFATFACVMAVITVTSGQIPWWGLFWLLGVAGHASRTLSALKRSRQADDTATGAPAGVAATASADLPRARPSPPSTTSSPRAGTATPTPSARSP